MNRFFISRININNVYLREEIRFDFAGAGGYPRADLKVVGELKQNRVGIIVLPHHASQARLPIAGING
jgi:hypothetical protein